MSEQRAGGEAIDAEVEEGADRTPPKKGLGRRLYDWVLHWAETPYGGQALGVLSFAESSFFPIPPDPLLIALCLGAAKKALRFALIATVASVLGGVLGYGIGAFTWSVTSDWFFQLPGVSPEAFDEVKAFYDRWGFWAVFLAGLTPFPYKVITLSAGVFAVSFPVFVVSSALSRGLRFFVVAGLIHRFGQPIAAFIDRYFNWLMWAFGILLIGGFLVIEFVL